MEVAAVKNKVAISEKKRSSAVAKSPMMAAFLAGSFSGTCSTILFQPLDLIKTRVQTQPGQGSRVSPGSVVTHVLRSEGVLGLWRGLWPSLMRTVPGVGIYFSTAHALRSRLGSSGDATSSLIIGCCARSVACSLMIPITVLKLRSEVSERGRLPLASSLRDILRVEGARGLVRGLFPTILRDAPFSGIYMMLYDMIRSAGL